MKKKFTLIELVTVLVIMSILVSIGYFLTADVKEDAFTSSVKANIRNIQTAVDLYSTDNHDKLPTATKPSLFNPQEIDFKMLYPKYLKNLPKDKDKVFYAVDIYGQVWGNTVGPLDKVYLEEDVYAWESNNKIEDYEIYTVKGYNPFIAYNKTSQRVTSLLSSLTNKTKWNIVLEKNLTPKFEKGVHRLKRNSNEAILISTVDKYGLNYAPAGIGMKGNAPTSDDGAVLLEKTGTFYITTNANGTAVWDSIEVIDHKPNGTDITYEYATSNDGENFSSFSNDFNALPNSQYLKVKIDMKSTNQNKPSIYYLKVKFHLLEQDEFFVPINIKDHLVGYENMVPFQSPNNQSTYYYIPDNQASGNLVHIVNLGHITSFQSVSCNCQIPYGGNVSSYYSSSVDGINYSTPTRFPSELPPGQYIKIETVVEKGPAPSGGGSSSNSESSSGGYYGSGADEYFGYSTVSYPNGVSPKVYGYTVQTKPATTVSLPEEVVNIPESQIDNFIPYPKEDNWVTLDKSSLTFDNVNGGQWIKATIKDFQPQNTRIIYTYSTSNDEYNWSSKQLDITKLSESRYLKVEMIRQVKPNAEQQPVVYEITVDYLDKDGNTKKVSSPTAQTSISIQTAVTKYKTNTGLLPTINQPSKIVPEKIDFTKLYPNYLPYQPNDSLYYWADYNGKVFASSVDSPDNVYIEESTLFWDKVEGAVQYKIYGLMNGDTLGYVGKTKELSFKGSQGITYLVSAVDSQGFSSAPSGPSYVGGTVNKPPSKPTINSSITGRDIRNIEEVTLTASGSVDPEGEPFTYIWEGRISETAKYPTGKHTIKVKAVDSRGKSSEWALYELVIVANKGPSIPTITISPDKDITTKTDVTITANNSVDPEGDKINYVWAGRTKETNTYAYGTHTLSVKAVDEYGASSPVQKVTFTVLLDEKDETSVIPPSYNEEEVVDYTKPPYVEQVPENWIPIRNIADLNNMKNDMTASYILMSDLDFSNEQCWIPIGNSANQFTGKLDGNGFTIKNLCVNSSTSYNGLFGYTNGATVKNLFLENANIKGVNYTGGIIGYSNQSSIENVGVTGTVTGQDYTGGLIGYTYTNTIKGSLANTRVKGRNYVGGFIGRTYYGNTYDSYSKGTTEGISTVGGFMGENYRSNAYRTYAAVEILSSNKGGYIYNLSDASNTTIHKSYWDLDVSTTSSSAIGNGRTHQQMTYVYSNAYVTWDFNNVWKHDDNHSQNDGYPMLFWEKKQGTKGLGSQGFNGKGTVENPYEIYTVEQLAYMFNFPDKHFILKSNIDATQTKGWNGLLGFIPVGNAEDKFTGSFNGNGFAINDLYINFPSNYVGLFGYTDGAKISNVKLNNANIKGQNYTGGIIGYSNNSTIENVGVNGFIEGKDYVGGLSGYTYSTVVKNSFSYSATKGAKYIGGFIGQQMYSTISNSYSRGSISGTDTMGGFLAMSYSGSVDKSYSAVSKITGTAYSGFIYNSNSSPNTPVTDSYWDQIVSQSTSSNGGEPRTSQQMKYLYQNTFFTWDFNQNWKNDDNHKENDGYPILKWEKKDGSNDLGTRGYKGKGTAEDPYQIQTLEQLAHASNFTSSHFILMNDIDATETKDWNNGKGFTPIGVNNNRFKGTFNGNGKVVSNLYINQSSTAYIGMFGYVSAGTIKNLELRDINIKGANYTGGLVGYTDTNSIIEKSGVSGNTSGTNYVGGLVGYTYSSTIKESFSNSIVTGKDYIGGFVGRSYYGNVYDSYSRGKAQGTTIIGGFIGENYRNNIYRTYSTVEVNGNSKGGFIYNLSDSSSTTIQSSFWDIDVANITSSGAGLSRTSQQMKYMYINTYSDWNFNDIWKNDDNHNQNNGYPMLKWEQKEGSTGLGLRGFKGEGTAENPYQVETLEQLANIFNFTSSHFILMNNIDATETKEWNNGRGFIPIGDSTTPFKGKFNGNGKVISNLFINQPSNAYIGMFGYVSGGTINDLVVEKVTIVGQNYTGGIAGYSDTKSIIKNVGVSGNITGADYTGGLIGYSYSSTVQDSFSKSTIIGKKYVGGFIGQQMYSTISNSYAKGNVSGTDTIGGFIAISYSGSVDKSYAAVSKTSGTAYSGFIYNSNSSPNTPVTDSYWDQIVSQSTSSNGGESRITQQMKYAYQNSFFTWDFSSHWKNDDSHNQNDGYPMLQWEKSEGSSGLGTKGFKGEGTAENPYQIETLEQLAFASNFTSSHFILINDIDASDTINWNNGRGFTPIGVNNNRFKGTFNGNGKVISNLFINQSSTAYIGMFGYVSAGTIKNLELKDANIKGANYTGGLVGYADTNTVIEKSGITGSVSGSNYVGGLIGYTYNSTIKESFANVQIVGRDYVGGFIGRSYYGNIYDSYSRGKTQGTTIVGGFIGENYRNNVYRTYSTVEVTGNSRGGYIYNLSDSSSTTIQSSFWDIDLAGITSSAAGLSRTSQQMKYMYVNAYSDWNFNTIWKHDDNHNSNDGYPILNWEKKSGSNLLGTRGFEGKGTSEEPYKITTLEQLNHIFNFPTAHFILMENIDATETKNWNNGKGFIPIGDSTTPFKGKFNGNGKIISNLFINQPSNPYTGLFGYIDSAVIQDVTLENTSVTGQNYTGGLVGYSTTNAQIINSGVTGKIIGSEYTGGIIGYAYTSTIKNSFSNSNIVGKKYVGGFIGQQMYSTISNSYARGNISGTDTIGGFISISYSGSVDKSYAAVSKTSGTAYSGFIYNSNSSPNTPVTDSYWDQTVSQSTSSNGGEPRITQQMKYLYQNTFFTWDFSKDWKHDDNHNQNDGYPMLKWEKKQGSYGLGTKGFEGAGTIENPYQIKTLEQLANASNFTTAHFILMNDIDAADTINWNNGKGFTPIGANNNRFKGIFDGNGKVVSNLFINSPSTAYTGMFGYVSGGTIKNLAIKDANITGANYTGGLVGYADTNSIIEKSGITGKVAGSNYVGGLVGYTYNTTIKEAFSNSIVLGKDYVGGFAGRTYYGNIYDSYSRGKVQGTTIIGGFIGENYRNNIYRTYSTVEVTGNSRGGYIYNLSDSSSTTIQSSFWDIDVASITSSGAGLSRTSQQMKYLYSNTYSDWNFNSIWKHDDTHSQNNGYPMLKWERKEGTDKLGTRGFKGTGTKEDPYQIETLEQLAYTFNFPSANFILINDIDATETKNWNNGRGFMPIGDSSTPFTGQFNGNGKTISNLFINQPSNQYIGLFGYLNGGNISNLSLENVDITGQNYTGGLTGYSTTNTKIINTGVTGKITGAEYTGGLIGYAHSNTVQNSFSNASIVGKKYVGGFIGQQMYSTISNSYARGSISGTDTIGGFMAISYSGSVDKSYAAVSKSNGTAYSGFIYNSNSSPNTPVTDSYWDQVVSQSTSSNGGEPRTSQQMKYMYQNTFYSWDFLKNWKHDDNQSQNDGYPMLQWEKKSGSVGLGSKGFKGNGTVEDPYQVETLEQLGYVSNFASSNFILMNDIDATDTINWNNGKGFTPIGANNYRFIGNFNGNGKKITNLYINSTSAAYVGLFGYLQSATVKDLFLENVNIKGQNYTGGLVGYSTTSVIENVHVSGTIEGNNYVAGLAGQAMSSTVRKSSVIASIKGNSNVSGLIAYSNGVYIEDSFAKGTVLGVSNSAGFISYNYRSNVYRTYSAVTLTGTSSKNGYIYNNADPSNSNIQDSFWDTTIANTTSNNGGTGKTSEELKNTSTFSNFDFSSVWDINSNQNEGYPYLR